MRVGRLPSVSNLRHLCNLWINSFSLSGLSLHVAGNAAGG
jgi:hypothetical protein